MIGAIDFINKAKLICEAEYNCETMFAIIDCIGGSENGLSPSELVDKVMGYEIEEGEDATTLL